MKRSRRGYVFVPAEGPTVVFVPDPDHRGRWIKTDPCVSLVPCPLCKAPVGAPCRGAKGFWSQTHFVRRDDAMLLKRTEHPCPTCHKTTYRPLDETSYTFLLSLDAIKLQSHAAEGATSETRLENIVKALQHELKHLKEKA